MKVITPPNTTASVNQKKMFVFGIIWRTQVRTFEIYLFYLMMFFTHWKLYGILVDWLPWLG